MDIKIKVNGTLICESVSPDLLLLDFLRKHGCYSVNPGLVMLGALCKSGWT